ncbi:bublin coiled-coil protein-like [Diachasmimorpha longicaudata]|uniref:bublin coiled-coil protein-like n=1 Tax=Diachasmimorpha longicaudata TaxID=58733 RepID=UPI0030B8EC36
MFDNAVEPHNDEEVEMDEGNGENDTEEEFQSLNAQLDQLNSALDTMEMKADNIHAELVELLKSNQETRKQFQDSVKREKISPDSQQ